MIFTGVINFILSIINSALDMIPVIDIAFSMEYFEGFLGFVNFCTYLFPIYALMPLLGIVISLTVFRITISFLKTVWAILPIV